MGRNARDQVALILAIGLSVALNFIVVAVLYDAIRGQEPLSENATQVLTGAFGGMIGVLGSYIGYRTAEYRYRGMTTKENNDEGADTRTDGGPP